jgi:hypothetical protein
LGQAKTQKLYRTFVKGLITEASYLTYPEDSSLDELNTVPSRKGNRTRRFGMNYATGNASAVSYDPTTAKESFMWNAVASQAAKSFFVYQNGNELHFFDRSVPSFALSKLPFIMDLRLYARPGVSDVKTQSCRFASGKGFLFVVNPDCDPMIVAYDPSTQTFSVTRLTILARDFEGLFDGLSNDAEPTTLTKEHYYNLLNQGWVSPRSVTVTG